MAPDDVNMCNPGGGVIVVCGLHYFAIKKPGKQVKNIKLSIEANSLTKRNQKCGYLIMEIRVKIYLCVLMNDELWFWKMKNYFKVQILRQRN